MPAKGMLVRENWRLLNSPAPQTVVTSAVQAVSAVLGAYEILLQVDVDTFIREDTDANLTATAVSATNGHFVPAGAAWTLIVDPGNKIGAISANGNLYISALG